VLAVHGIDVVVEAGDGFVPTPVVSHDILAHNPDRTTRLADGIVVTPRTTRPRTAAIAPVRPPSGSARRW
jgi:phosphoglucomutase